jgi:hypothetical protein
VQDVTKFTIVNVWGPAINSVTRDTAGTHFNGFLGMTTRL